MGGFMKRLTAGIVLALAFMILIRVRAEDMYLTLDDGAVVVLHADYTWEVSPDSPHGSIQTQKVMLDDGRALVIEADKTWKYAGGGSAKSMVSTMYAIGVAKRADLTEASAAAMIEATRRLALQIQPIADNPEIDHTIIMRCIDNSEKAVNAAEEKTDGWKVTVKVTLDETGIDQVMQCLVQQNQ